jgi:hypothetical protein
MKPVLKVAIVASGYLLAFLMARAAVALHVAVTSESDPKASGGGMSAFGDLILFVVVFGAVSLVPTGTAVYFLFSKKKTPTQTRQQVPTDGAPDV